MMLIRPSFLSVRASIRVTVPATLFAVNSTGREWWACAPADGGSANNPTHRATSTDSRELPLTREMLIRSPGAGALGLRRGLQVSRRCDGCRLGCSRRFGLLLRL